MRRVALRCPDFSWNRQLRCGDAPYCRLSNRERYKNSQDEIGSQGLFSITQGQTAQDNVLICVAAHHTIDAKRSRVLAPAAESLAKLLLHLILRNTFKERAAARAPNARAPVLPNNERLWLIFIQVLALVWLFF